MKQALNAERGNDISLNYVEDANTSREQEIGAKRVFLTEEDNRRISRKTDATILTILVWVYFLQILDKSVLGYGAIFDLETDTHLTGNQYSLVGSIAPIAQLAWQPFSAFLIVKVPHRILMPSLLLGWGIAQAAMASCKSFSGLIAARFFLGLFEGGCLPLFSIITSNWYRRSEQPLRVAAWYSTNGLATIFAAGVSYGLAKIQTDKLAPWQIIFLFVGLLTIASVPIAYWRLDNSPAEARFLTPLEREQAVERLRANQTGSGGISEIKWHHITEAALDLKTYLWIGMALLDNLGAQVTVTFGPLILKGLGFDKYTTSLLNMPFGALQFLVILLTSYAAAKSRYKSIVLALIMLPVVAGLATLYVLPRNGQVAGLLVSYYLLAFLYGGIPLIVSWIVANTAGSTKKSVLMSVYQAATSAGNIIGPLLFTPNTAPAYTPGLRKVLGVFIALVVVALIQLGVLVMLNKSQERRRVKNGKPAMLLDHSMQKRYEDIKEGNEEDAQIGEKAFEDLTDRENDEFVYVY